MVSETHPAMSEDRPQNRALVVKDPNTSTPVKSSAPSKPTQKRTHAAISNDENSAPGLSVDDIDDEDPRLAYVTDDCNQMRRKINTFINNGGMKVGVFQKAIDVSAGSYSRFLKQTGRDTGSGSDCYYNAFTFFKKREIAGVGMPRAKKAKTSSSGGAGAKGNEDDRWDVSGIKLDGEDEGKVPVFETCDSMRRVIAAHLRRDGITQAGFCREISKCLGAEAKPIPSPRLTAFMGKHGPKSGCSSTVFYGSYVYFEKLRVKGGKAKSKFREEMEEQWGKHGGFDLEYHAGGYFASRDEVVTEDKYGMVHIYRRR